jgi:thiol-disulfide isomerase/thioredoxin
MILMSYECRARVAPKAVQVRIAQTVLIFGVAWAGACATPTKERPAGSAATASSPAPTPAAGPTPPSAPSGEAPLASAPTASAPTAVAEPESKTGSAYFGCGRPIPHDKLWDETQEAQVLEAISVAKACAAEHQRKLLLEFVAPWCEDCQEMAKLDETAVVSSVLQERFERVRINVGKWDRHEALRKNFDVRALATYIVIDPKTSQLLAKTTLEPITKRGQKLSAEDWAKWLSAH